MLQRVLVGKPATLEITLLDQNGLPTEAEGEVSAEVSRLDGSSVDIGEITTGDGPGRFKFLVAASELGQIDDLAVVLSDESGNTERADVSVVSRYYFSTDDVRNSDVSLRGDTVNWNDIDIVRLRPMVEVICERMCKQAFVPRLARQVLSGDSSNELLLERAGVRSVRAVKINGESLGQGDLDSIEVDPVGVLYLTSGRWSTGHSNVEVIFEHGSTFPPPDIVGENIVHLSYLMGRDRSGIDPRALSLSTVDGTIQYATAGRGGFELGIPSVDALYRSYRDKVPGIA